MMINKDINSYNCYIHYIKGHPDVQNCKFWANSFINEGKTKTLSTPRTFHKATFIFSYEYLFVATPIIDYC